MNLKVNNCGECPFCVLQEEWGKSFCERPDNKITETIKDESIIHPSCPEGGAFEIKTEPIKIKEDETENGNATRY